MASNDTSFVGEVRYTRELRLRQVVSLGLRASLPAAAFLALGPLTAISGRGAPAALLLGVLLWLPTVLSYAELATHSSEGGIFEVTARYRSGLLAFLATWVLLLSTLLTAGLLASETAKLLQPWLLQAIAVLSPQAATGLLTGLALALALLTAVARRRPWRSGDDLVLIGGMIAIGMTVLSAIVTRAPEQSPGLLVPVSFEAIVAAAVFPVVLLLGVEAVGEWKAEMVHPRRNTPRAMLGTVAVLALGTFVLLLSALRINASLLASQGLAAVVADLPGIPLPLAAALLFALVLVAGASSLLLQANRTIGQLAREGYLPQVRFSSQGLNALFALLVLAFASGALLLLPTALAAGILTGLLLLLAITICAMAILRRPLLEAASAEMQARSPQGRAFRLPFPPLVPAVGLAIASFLILSLEWRAALGLGAVLLLGLVIYLVYGRTAHRQVGASRTVIRPAKTPRAEPAPGESHPFRILVPLLDSPAEQRELIQLAKALAAPTQGEVLALQVITVPPQQKRSEGERLAQERNQLLRWFLGKGEVDLVPLTRIGRDPLQAILDTAREEHCDLILLRWHVGQASESPVAEAGSPGAQSRLVNQLVHGVPAMVAAVSGELEPGIKRILVPTAGGPHAPAAADLAMRLAVHWDAQVIGLTILRDESDESAQAQARERIADTFAGLPGAENVDVCLVTSQEPIAAALVKQANEHSDLVMLGASNEGLLDRVLFGDIPQQVAEQTDVPAILVRAERPPQEAWLRLLWDRLQGVFVALDLEEQIDLYRNMRRGARPNINFFVLIVLSAIIATLGLRQDSVAVIIGAMLVAPLMTPILATSLGIVMGDARMIRVALEATVKGVLLAIAIAAFITALLPETALSDEIIARTQPTIVDLGVALASGAAGAYALGRKEVSAALPGVAIAAALMPPLCTVGIGLAYFAGNVAGGAMLLFSTNLVAIILAGGLVFLLLGMRPRRGEQERAEQFRRGLTIAVVLLVIITIPLVWLGARNAIHVRDQNTVDEWLGPAVQSSNAELLQTEVRREEGELFVWARVQVLGDPLEQGTVDAWAQQLAEETGRPVHLEIDALPIERLYAEEP